MQPDPDLTRLSPAALDAWLGECEKEAVGKFLRVRLPALVRYVRTMQPLREQLKGAEQEIAAARAELVNLMPLIGQAAKLRAERDALAARVAELEGALKAEQRRVLVLESLLRGIGLQTTNVGLFDEIDAALAGGEETK